MKKWAESIFIWDLGQPFATTPVEGGEPKHVPRFAVCAHVGRGQIEVVEPSDDLDVLYRHYGELPVLPNGRCARSGS